MKAQSECIAARINAPSPPVGEGYAAGQHGITWVRGTLSALAMRRQPLTRRDAHYVRVTPPSPTRGEGNKKREHRP